MSLMKRRDSEGGCLFEALLSGAQVSLCPLCSNDTFVWAQRDDRDSLPKAGASDYDDAGPARPPYCQAQGASGSILPMILIQ